ncbi:MAG: tetratricopeptide repeat protein [Candidatus Zipacnadales bacterium]
MKWRLFIWIVRIAVIVTFLYGAWSGVSYFGGRHYFRRGMATLMSNPKEAVRQLNIAVKLQPKNPRYRAALGRAVLRTDRPAAAVVHLRIASEMRPDDFGIWYDLGKASLDAGDTAQAKVAFERALAIRPDAYTALEGLAEAARQTGDAEAALAPLRKLRERASADLKLAEDLAACLCKTGHYDEALKTCQQSLSQIVKEQERSERPNWKVACPFLAVQGDVYCFKGRWREALQVYLTCLSLNPDNQEAAKGLKSIPVEFARPINVAGKPCGPAFARHGVKLAFYVLGKEGGGLYVLDTPDAQPRKVAQASNRAFGDAPAWSPDGSRLCYISRGQLHVIKADGTGNRELVKQPATLTQLPKLKLAGGPRSVADFMPRQRSPVWSPDCQHIAYWAWDPHRGAVTCVVDVASGKAMSIHRTSGAAPELAALHPPAWTPDGRLLCGPLYYASLKQPAIGLTLWNSEGLVKRQIPAPETRGPKIHPGTPNTYVAWAPDSQHLAVALIRDRRDYLATADLAIIHATGKRSWIAARNIAVGVDNPLSFARWVNSKRVWFLRKTGSHPLEGGVKATIADTSGNVEIANESFPIIPQGEWALSADRKLLAMASPHLPSPKGGPGLWLFNIEKLSAKQK